MYKTIWRIYDGAYRTEFTQYHFGKTPRFPSWYMEIDTTYEIEMVWSVKLINSLKMFIKCLFKEYKIC